MTAMYPFMEPSHIHPLKEHRMLHHEIIMKIFFGLEISHFVWVPNLPLNGFRSYCRIVDLQNVDIILKK
jgi:hypothetical protein